MAAELVIGPMKSSVQEHSLQIVTVQCINKRIRNSRDFSFFLYKPRRRKNSEEVADIFLKNDFSKATVGWNIGNIRSIK